MEPSEQIRLAVVQGHYRLIMPNLLQNACESASLIMPFFAGGWCPLAATNYLLDQLGLTRYLATDSLSGELQECSPGINPENCPHKKLAKGSGINPLFSYFPGTSVGTAIGLIMDRAQVPSKDNLPKLNDHDRMVQRAVIYKIINTREQAKQNDPGLYSACGEVLTELLGQGWQGRNWVAVWSGIKHIGQNLSAEPGNDNVMPSSPPPSPAATSWPNIFEARGLNSSVPPEDSRAAKKQKSMRRGILAKAILPIMVLLLALQQLAYSLSTACLKRLSTAFYRSAAYQSQA